MSGGTIERARGRWREILPQLGVETRFLVNKHGPCRFAAARTDSGSTIRMAAAHITATSAVLALASC